MIQKMMVITMDGETMIESIKGFFGNYRFLSNFAPAKIVWEGIEYPTTEHAFQAAKTLDQASKLLIAAADSPGEAKKLGRKVAMRSDWDMNKYHIMLQICRLKFADPKYREQLLATNDAYLEETNTWGDKIWGVCDGEGTNWLGKILMQIRQEIS